MYGEPIANDGGVMLPTGEATKDDGWANTNAISHASATEPHVTVVRVANLMHSFTSSSLLRRYYAT